MHSLGRYTLNGLTVAALSACVPLLIVCLVEDETFDGRHRFRSRDQELGRYAGSELEAYVRTPKPRRGGYPQPVQAYERRGEFLGVE